MGTSKAIDFVFILFWISTVNSLVQLPRKHIVDYTTFSTQLTTAVSSEYIWKAIWQFSADSEADIQLRYGPEYQFEIIITDVLDLYSNTMDLNTNLCNEGGSQFFHPPGNLAAFLSGSTYLAFFSSNPTEYLWMFECELNFESNCPEAGAKITFLFNQGNSPFKRPEGINWARALKDLYQATRLRLEDVRGSWRAVYKYKPLTRK